MEAISGRWTREAVRELIEDRYGVRYAMQSLSVLLKRWGFTPQRPIKKAYEQNSKAVDVWLEQTYPGIEDKALDKGAEIFGGDESAVKPEAHHRRSYAPKGQTPVIRQPAKRFHSSFISAISKRGKLHWMGLSKPLNADLFIDFLKRLIKNRKRKIFLILDNLRVHHCQKVKDWVQKHKKRIELFFLPSYSPELNPDEYLNQGLKKVIFRHALPKISRNWTRNWKFHFLCSKLNPKQSNHSFNIRRFGMQHNVTIRNSGVIKT